MTKKQLKAKREKRRKPKRWTVAIGSPKAGRTDVDWDHAQRLMSYYPRADVWEDRLRFYAGVMDSTPGETRMPLAFADLIYLSFANMEKKHPRALEFGKVVYHCAQRQLTEREQHLFYLLVGDHLETSPEEAVRQTAERILARAKPYVSPGAEDAPHTSEAAATTH